MPEHRKRFDGVLGIIVVPGHTIVNEKCEQLVSILLKSLFDRSCRLALKIRARESSVETVYKHEKLS
jgi:hypothetical protein